MQNHICTYDFNRGKDVKTDTGVNMGTSPQLATEGAKDWRTGL